MSIENELKEMTIGQTKYATCSMPHNAHSTLMKFTFTKVPGGFHVFGKAKSGTSADALPGEEIIYGNLVYDYFVGDSVITKDDDLDNLDWE